MCAPLPRLTMSRGDSKVSPNHDERQIRQSMSEPRDQTVPANVPEISVVVASGDRHHRTIRCLAGVFAQSCVEKAEVIVIDGSPGDHSDLYSHFPGLRYVHTDDRSSITAQRLEGLKLARAPIVAFLEDHVVPYPGWLAAVSGAFARSEKIGVVNYCIVQSPGGGYVNRALQMTQYGHWLKPVSSGPIRYAACQNLAYRRDLLQRISKDNFELFECEFLMHRRLLRDGWSIWLAADAEIDHENYDSVVAACKGYGALKQILGAGRAALYGWPQPKRWLWAAGMILSPFVLIGRLALSIAPRPRLWGEFLAALPVAVVTQIWGAFCEARGYVRGFERSRVIFLESESYEERTS
jgi:glycosyltransferase involved in cell wall biosynthesis